MPTQKILTVVVALSGFITIAWPICDLLYTGRFQPSGGWWLALFAAHSAGFLAITRNQKDLSSKLDTFLTEIQEYGDQREVAGQRLATRIKNNNPLRPLNPVE